LNVTLDERSVELLDLLTKATGANRSELLRRGVTNHWFAMEKPLLFALRGDDLTRAKELFRELKKSGK